MTERLWTIEQTPRLLELQSEYQIPGKIVEGIQSVLTILDRYYGKERKVDEDDGGYVLLLFCDSIDDWHTSYVDLLKKYHLQETEVEFRDIVYENPEIEWHSDLFLVSSDYGITLVYPVKKGEVQ